MPLQLHSSVNQHFYCCKIFFTYHVYVHMYIYACYTHAHIWYSGTAKTSFKKLSESGDFYLGKLC